MDLLQLKRLIDLFRHAPVNELEIEEGSQKVRLVRGAAKSAPSEQHDKAAAPLVVAAPEARTCGAPDVVKTITAPAAGVFHASPSPGAAPYVTVGQDVERGQHVGLVEAMKVFNTIRAEQPGRIAEIVVADGAEVEAGALLFRLA